MNAQRKISLSTKCTLCILILCSTIARSGVTDLDAESHSSYSIDQNSATTIAINIVREFASLARIYDDSLNDRAEEFESLFSINAQLPLDFIKGKQDQMNGPEKYVAEFYSSKMDRPIPVEIEIKENKARSVSRGNKNGFKVIVPIKKTFTHLVVNKQLIRLENPLVLMQDVEVIVTENGAAQINRITPALASIPNQWSLDLFYLNDLSNPQYNERAELNLMDKTDTEFKLNNMGANIRYHFYPFTKGGRAKKNTSFSLALGFEHWRYRMAEAQLNDREGRYRNEDLFATEHTGNSSSSIMSASGENFVRFGNVIFNEEKVGTTALSFHIGGTIPLILKDNSQTLLELGIGYTAGSTKDVSYYRQYSDSLIFTEEFFEGNPVVITNEGVWYNGSFEELESPLNVYELQDRDDQFNYTLQFASTVHFDAKLIQMFKLGRYDLGGYVTVRQQLSSTLTDSADSSQSLLEVVDGGVPRLVAFTDKLLPIYLGLGLRVRKSK